MLTALVLFHYDNGSSAVVRHHKTTRLRILQFRGFSIIFSFPPLGITNPRPIEGTSDCEPSECSHVRALTRARMPTTTRCRHRLRHRQQVSTGASGHLKPTADYSRSCRANRLHYCRSSGKSEPNKGRGRHSTCAERHPMRKNASPVR